MRFNRVLLTLLNVYIGFNIEHLLISRDNKRNICCVDLVIFFPTLAFCSLAASLRQI